MVEDLQGCMEQYEDCGGKYDRDGLSAERVATAKAAADEADPPSTHAPCSSYFSGAVEQTVMSTEAEVIKVFDLGTCCSD